MVTYTKVIKNKDYISNLKEASIDFLELIINKNRPLINQNLFVVDISSGISFLLEISKKKKWTSIVRKTFIQCFLSAERSAKGSGIFACYCFSKLFLGYSPENIKSIQKTSQLISGETTKNMLLRLVGEDICQLFFKIIITFITDFP